MPSTAAATRRLCPLPRRRVQARAVQLPAMEREEALALFENLTGAAPHVAEHVLDAHGWVLASCRPGQLSVLRAAAVPTDALCRSRLRCLAQALVCWVLTARASCLSSAPQAGGT